MDRISRLLEFLEKNPADSFCRHALAMEYVKTGDDGAARRELERLLAGNPGYVGSYYHLGKLLERTGDAARAREVYADGIKAATAAGDAHAARELRTAIDLLEDTSD